MSWPSIQSDVLHACQALLEPHGYKLVKSRTSFERPTATGRLSVRLLFVASDVGNYSLRVGCGVRHDAIERIVDMGRAPEQRSNSAWTINAEWSNPLSLNSAEEQAEAVSGLHEYIRAVALPFLGREYSLEDFSTLLNVTDAEGLPIERSGMGVHFWQRGLAAARLAGDGRFESLRRHYTHRVHSLSNGLYLPEFEKSLTYMDDHIA